jgi:diguanylate cyclase (GGDEF)-like protein
VIEGMKDLLIQKQLASLGTITVSAGLAIHPEHATGGASLLAAADAALYQAKRQGRNRVVIANFTPMPPTPSPKV